jgi:hypothetical protein
MSKDAERLKREAGQERLRRLEGEADQEERIERRFRQAGLTAKQLEEIEIWERAEAHARSWNRRAPEWADIVEAAMLMLAEVTARGSAGTLDELVAGLPPLKKSGDRIPSPVIRAPGIPRLPDGIRQSCVRMMSCQIVVPLVPSPGRRAQPGSGQLGGRSGVYAVLRLRDASWHARPWWR